MRKIFISHISQHAQIADTIREGIQNKLSLSHDIFFQSSRLNDIPFGESWHNAIIDNLDKSKVMVAILSDEWQEHPYILFEIAYALGRRIPIIPIVTSKDNSPNAEHPLSHYQSIQWDDGKNIDYICNEIQKRYWDSEDIFVDAIISTNRYNLSPNVSLLKCRLINKSNKHQEILRIEQFVPSHLISKHFIEKTDPDVMKIIEVDIEGVKFRRKTYVANIQSDRCNGIELLPSIIPPNDRIDLGDFVTGLEMTTDDYHQKIITKLFLKNNDSPCINEYYISDIIEDSK